MRQQKLQLVCSLVCVSVGEKFRLVIKVFVWGFFALAFVFELTNFCLSSFHFLLKTSVWLKAITKEGFRMTFPFDVCLKSFCILHSISLHFVMKFLPKFVSSTILFNVRWTVNEFVTKSICWTLQMQKTYTNRWCRIHTCST